MTYELAPSFEELFSLEPVHVPHDVKSVRELMTEYDADDNVNGWWTFSDSGSYPYCVEAINRAAMRDGRLADMVGDDIAYAIAEGTDLLTGTIY